MAYTDKIVRHAANELPSDYSRDVIQGVVESSAVMALARRVAMPSHTTVMPALATFPSAYWLNGATRIAEDTVAKQTTTMTWSNVSLVAAELAVLVAIPDALVQDELFDILGEVRPRLVEEFGRKIDNAALWGDEKPTLWGASGVGIFDAAITAGNVVTPATTVPTGTGDDASPDLAQQFGYAAELLALDGFVPNGFAVQPGLPWRLRNMRATGGETIYSGNTGVAGAQAETLFGERLFQVRNGSWDSARAVGIIGDWNNAMVGVRQDITFSISDSATIYDPADGTVKYSAYQQDGKVLRAVMRVAFATANPIHRLNSNSSTRYPFAVVTPTDAPSS